MSHCVLVKMSIVKMSSGLILLLGLFASVSSKPRSKMYLIETEGDLMENTEPHGEGEKNPAKANLAGDRIGKKAAGRRRVPPRSLVAFSNSVSRQCQWRICKMCFKGNNCWLICSPKC